MKKPYIGITGFTTRAEVVRIISEIPRMSDRLLMVGVLASLKTLNGRTNKYPDRYPRVSKISEIFSDNDQAVLNLIHYNTDEAESLDQQLLKAIDLGGKNLHGFQSFRCSSSSAMMVSRPRHRPSTGGGFRSAGPTTASPAGHSP